MIVIKNKRAKTENILKEYPDAEIFDVTSKGEYKRLSPFYPHGGIPVPFLGTVAIRWHMGAWDLAFQSYEAKSNINEAGNRHPLLSLIQAADNMATHILEQ